MKGVYMGAFSEGFMAGLSNPKATRGIAQAGSAFYDWMKGEAEKRRKDEAFEKSMREFDASPYNQDNKDPFGYFDQGPSGATGGAGQQQGPDPAQIESEKMLKQIEQGIQRFMDSGNPRNNPQQYFSQPVTPRGRHVDPTYDRHR